MLETIFDIIVISFITEESLQEPIENLFNRLDVGCESVCPLLLFENFLFVDFRLVDVLPLILFLIVLLLFNKVLDFSLQTDNLGLQGLILLLESTDLSRQPLIDVLYLLQLLLMECIQVLMLWAIFLELEIVEVLDGVYESICLHIWAEVEAIPVHEGQFL